MLNADGTNQVKTLPDSVFILRFQLYLFDRNQNSASKH